MEFIGFKRPYRLHDIVELARKTAGVDVRLQAGSGDPLTVIGVTNGRSAAPGALCFVDRIPAAEALPRLQSAVIMSSEAIAPSLPGCTLILAKDPRALFIDCIEQIRLAQGFVDFSSALEAVPGIHPSARIHPAAVIEDGVYIGQDATVAAGCVIKHGTWIGDSVTVRENTVIGTDGIALYKAVDGRVRRFPHLGGVIIEASVEIGAGCVISQGVLNATRIGRDTVIGNLSNIGHTARIGARVWMSVGCMIGGNTHLGDGCTLGLGVAVRDNLRLGQSASVGMGSVVVNDIADNHSVFGNPARRLPDVKAGPDR